MRENCIFSSIFRLITASIGESDSLQNSVSFFDLFPHNSTKRRDALSAFYTCLSKYKKNDSHISRVEKFNKHK